MIKVNILHKDELYDKVFKEFENEFKIKKKLCLGLSTGSSPIELYKKFVLAYENGLMDFSNVKTFNLDEYLGLDLENENSYHYFMNKNLFSQVNIQNNNIYFPPTDEKKISEYEKVLEENPIDIQLLGIGGNGHIAFNEPGTSFSSTTRIVDLAEKTIFDNSRFFKHISEVPKKAVTTGLENIMSSKKIILIAIGSNKAEILHKVLKDDQVTEEIPVTILKKHSDVTFYIDEEAAALLK